MTSAERTREYRRRRWQQLEDVIRRVVREELAYVENTRRIVDNPVDKRHSRGRAPVDESESGYVSSVPESVGDAAPSYPRLDRQLYAELAHVRSADLPPSADRATRR